MKKRRSQTKHRNDATLATSSDLSDMQHAATQYPPPGVTIAAPEEGRVARQVAEAQVAQEWNVGDVILDTYEVTGLLGEGGMGKVYKVHHRSWNVDLAVKCPHPHIFAQAGGAENFGREAETWVNLGLHPHIVSCHYVRTLGGIPRVFAEYVTGGSLSEWIRDRKLTALNQMLDVAIQFAWGLHYAHEQGLVHQDVKPANVMMTLEGVAQVTDFGLARARAMVEGATVEASAGHSVVVPGSGLMTREYASPEQVAGKPLTRRTDLWSWGASLLEMFAGGRFWQWGPAVAESLNGYLEEGSEAEGLPRMPEQVVVLLRQCFREDPAERPRDMLEVVTVLQEVYEQQVGRPHPRQMPKAVELRADSLNNKALSLLDLGQPEKAVAAWEEALQLDALHIGSVYNQGLLQWRSARITDAALLERIGGVSASHPGEWEVAYLLGQVHLERGDGAAAKKTLHSIQGPDAGRGEVAAALALAKENEAARRLSRTFEGHTDGVTSVCLSADGRYAFSGSHDIPLRLWDVASGRCLRTFEGHTEWATSVSLSADGRYGLSGSDDKTLKLWDVASGRCLRTFEGHTEWVKSVSLSADGRYALSGGWDKVLKLWDVASGRCLRTFEGHTGVVSSVCWNADGRHALSGSPDKTLKLWEVTSGRCLRTFVGHTSSVVSVYLSADGRYALSGSDDNTLKLWEVTSGRCLRTFVGHTRVVHSVCLSADGRHAMSGSTDWTLKLWEVASGRCLCTFAGHKGSVNSVCLSADGRYALSGSTDKTLKLWEAQLGINPPAAPFMLSQARAVQEVVSSQTAFAQALAQAHQALKQGQAVEAARQLRQALAQSGFARAAPALALWYRLYTCLPRSSWQGGWEAATFEGHMDSVLSVCLSADGRYALSGSADKTLRLWEVESGRCLRTFEGHKGSVNSACLSADGRYALSGSSDHTLRLWEVTSGRCLRTFAGHSDTVWSVYLSADGCYALSGSADKTLKLWEVASERCLRTFEGHTRVVHSVCLSADGRHALSGGNDMSLRLWEAASGRCLRTFEGHKFIVNSARLSADGRYALSGSKDDTLKLWEVESGRCLRTFEGHPNGVSSVCLSANGRYALSGSYDTTLKLWEVQLGVNLPATPFMLSRVRTSGDVISSQAAYDQALAQARQAFERGQAVEAAKYVRLARAQPGYQHAAEALEIWYRLYLRLPRKSLNAGWEAATFQGHPDGVTSVCLSADGRYALSGGDETLKLWEVESGRCLRTFQGHTKSVTSVCLSADGRYALSGGDETLKLWEVESGRCLRTFEGDMDDVYSVCLSADGRYALSGSWQTLKLWEVESGRCLRTFQGHTGVVNSVCLSADGRYALSLEDTPKLWEVESGRCLRTFEGHTSEVNSMCLSADGRYALSGGSDETLKLWEVESGRCLRTFEGHTNYVSSVCLSADGRYALSGSWQTLKLWEVESGRCLRTFQQGHPDEVTSVCLSADGRYALSGSSDKTLKLWALDWELEDKEPVDWDEGARPYLKVFLTQHTPYAGTLPQDRHPTEEEITLALTRRGKPSWTEEDFQRLLYTLGCAGYGWLKPEGVQRELEKMARERKG